MKIFENPLVHHDTFILETLRIGAVSKNDFKRKVASTYRGEIRNCVPARVQQRHLYRLLS